MEIKEKTIIINSLEKLLAAFKEIFHEHYSEICGSMHPCDICHRYVTFKLYGPETEMEKEDEKLKWLKRIRFNGWRPEMYICPKCAGHKYIVDYKIVKRKSCLYGLRNLRRAMKEA